MDLNTIWFILISVLFIGFFILEGFDYGVGILLPFLGKNDKERRMIINTIGPHWDGNEVWLITAGGAMFAAFPHWYATLFSGFYLALLLMLVALIVRGVAFEFRSKDRKPEWRSFWDWMIFVGSLVPALLWGVALGNLIVGVPIDADMNYVGTFWDLLNPYALACGVTTVLGMAFHGGIFLALKTGEPIEERAQRLASRLWLPTLLLAFGVVAAGYFVADLFAHLGVNPGLIPLTAGAALLLSGYFLHTRRHGWAFAATSVSIAFTIITIFRGLYPRVMVSSLDPAYSLTIFNASSSDYTLRIMLIVALIFVPIVLLYQGWSYWAFRQRVMRDSELEY